MTPRWMHRCSVVLVVSGLSGCAGEPDERTAEHRAEVIGGQAEPDAYGFALPSDVKNAMVAVTSNGQPQCSGTIIGDRLVVSGGHCYVSNSQAWLEGADPAPLFPAQVAALEVRVGPSLDAPECVFTVTDAILNPELALRDLDTEGGHANPHDSAVLVLGESVLENCPSAWPARVRLEPLTAAIVGQEGLQGGFGATTESGTPANHDRWWSHFSIAAVHDLDVAVNPLGSSHVWYGDSGSGVLLPTEDGGVEVIAAVSNIFRHARLDIDADWLASLFVDGALCGPATAEGTCIGDAIVTCAPESGLARVECSEMGLACVPGDGGAQCGCACDPCDPGCACAVDACEDPNGAGGGDADGDHADGCATRPGKAGHTPFWLALMLGWMMRRRRDAGWRHR